MHVDYTELFTTPDELVYFLMKSHEEQNKILAELVAEKEKVDVVLVCKIAGKGIGD